MRDIITLECAECKRRNYTTTKNKKKQSGRVEYKKYCHIPQGNEVGSSTRQ